MKLDGRRIRVLEQHKVNPDYKTNKRQVFIIGSKGIPANYGGFETFVEKLTEHQVNDFLRYHVSRMGEKDFRFLYNGAKCFNVRVPDIGAAKAVFYDIKALQWCIAYCRARPAIRFPVFYVLACRIGPFIPYFKRQIQKLGGILYVNPDGHEWLRRKWSLPVRRYWKLSERLMVKYADLLICDSVNIEAYIQSEYKRFHPKTTYIAYGADTRRSALTDHDRRLADWYRENGLARNHFYLAVGRFVPENNFEIMIREFMRSGTKRKFAIITTGDNAFLDKLEKKLHFRKDPRIRFVGTVYDQELLKKIRENAYGYLHGHEVGGTNPSLLEALGSTKLNLLLGVDFNREVGGDGALYWTKADGMLAGLIDSADAMSKEEIGKLAELAKERICNNYRWDNIVEQYEKVFLEGVSR